jgi:hypothetical protein
MVRYGKKKIEPNTVIKFGIGFLFWQAFMCSTILGFTDAEGLTSLCFYFGVFSDYLWRLSLSLVYVWLSPKIIWDDDGNGF